MIRTFEEHPTRKWREGVSKTSFNYLLLDPRISGNLPKRAVTMSDLEIWNCFLSSVFYVGKGKKARPYAHLYEAVSSWRSTCQSSRTNDKVNENRGFFSLSSRHSSCSQFFLADSIHNRNLVGGFGSDLPSCLSQHNSRRGVLEGGRHDRRFPPSEPEERERRRILRVVRDVDGQGQVEVRSLLTV